MFGGDFFFFFLISCSVVEVGFLGSYSGRLEVGAYTFLGKRSEIFVNLSGNMNLEDLGIK